MHLLALRPIFLALAVAVSTTVGMAQTPATSKPKLGSMVFDWAKIEPTTTPTGERRAIVNAPTATMANFSCHVTTLNAHQAPHPAHRHPDEEIIIVKEGTIEVMINEERQRAGAGSMFFFASNDLHGMRNVGDTRATYYVIRVITPDTPKPAGK
ncbi:MAG: cupin domain-containing protein [Opitutaceae bacterium]|nr:cupin domain-containing protein [Opitutaceae bacterium]